jgi:[ribosomal protein S5]-alanine N-acetyltransferase
MTLSYPQPELSDEVLRLRPWSLDDLACVEEATADPRIPEGTTVPMAYDQQAGVAFIERQSSRHAEGQGISLAMVPLPLVRAVGSIVLLHRPQSGVVGIGYWVVGSARGHGYATRAARLLSDWALDVAGCARVEAWVEPSNEASRRVLAAAGFQLEGHLRSFLSFATRRSDALVLARVATG